jgi:hypothetical protein
VPTLADLFSRRYDAAGVDFAAIRVHHGGGPTDRACRALGARAFTAGTDIFFAAGAFQPDTAGGLWLLAHEVAHVAQQSAGLAAASRARAGVTVAAPGTALERAADAAADAVLAGRSFAFGPARRPVSAGPGQARNGRLVQRYMSWEHAMLGDIEPDRLHGAAGGGDPRPVAEYRDLLTELGRTPGAVDEARLRAAHPGLDAVRLPGSGLVVTLGELNVLPDFLGRPEEIERAPRGFVEPLVQSMRSWNIGELGRPAAGVRGWRPLAVPVPPTLLPGSLRYPLLGPLAETAEIAAISSLGRRQGLSASRRYAAVLARNSGHFAPFSWYRWHSFHVQARELIAMSGAASGQEREDLRQRARIFAGYADHFLQDSFAAGHLVNKTLVIQWYIEWLAEQGVSYPGRDALDTLTVARQPLLHGPGHYDRGAAHRAALAGAGGAGVVAPPWDAQDVADAATLEERIAGSGVTGGSDAERRAAYDAYLVLLGSGSVQLAVKVVHEYLNKHSLIVSASYFGPRFRLNGDHTLLAGRDGALRAAQAAAMSRRAIAELLRDGETTVSSWDIFDSFPDHVEQAGRMVSLPDWHRQSLRTLCTELFAQPSTRAVRGLMSTALRQLGLPSHSD